MKRKTEAEYTGDRIFNVLILAGILGVICYKLLL